MEKEKITFNYLIEELAGIEMKKQIRLEILDLYNNGLRDHLGHGDILSIEEFYKNKVEGIENIYADFESYYMLIVGSCDYVIFNSIFSKRIPVIQKRYLLQDFFCQYPTYYQLQYEEERFPNFFKELLLLEQARKL